MFWRLGQLGGENFGVYLSFGTSVVVAIRIYCF